MIEKAEQASFVLPIHDLSSKALSASSRKSIWSRQTLTFSISSRFLTLSPSMSIVPSSGAYLIFSVPGLNCRLLWLSKNLKSAAAAESA